MAAKKKQPAEVTAASATAFDKLQARWTALTSSDVVTLNVDLDLAATAGLVLVDRARKPGRLELFEGLAPRYVEKDLIAHLEMACEAAQHVVVESVKEEAVVTGVKVDAAIVDRGNVLRRRMLKCLAYNLEGNEPAEKEIADIRRGVGYLDQSRDLSRVSAMYKVHRAVLVDDKKNYVETDQAEALVVSQQIRDQYRASQSTENLYVALRPKAFTEVQRLYNEVREAALFIFRAQDEVKAEFEALRTAMATVKGRSGSGASGSEGGEEEAPAGGPTD
jgi:hypothetical protein